MTSENEFSYLFQKQSLHEEFAAIEGSVEPQSPPLGLGISPEPTPPKSRTLFDELDYKETSPVPSLDTSPDFQVPAVRSLSANMAGSYQRSGPDLHLCGQFTGKDGQSAAR